MSDTYGYIRVRKFDGEQQEQITIIKTYIREERRLYLDSDGSSLQKLIAVLKAGDHLYIDDLSSLGDSILGIQKIWQRITDGLHVKVTVSRYPELSCDQVLNADNSVIVNRVLETVGNGIALYRAEYQAEGYARAKKEGKNFGRPRKQRPKDIESIYRQWKEGTISLEESASMYEVSRSTVYHWLREIEIKNGDAVK